LYGEKLAIVFMMLRHHPEQCMATEHTEEHRKNFPKCKKRFCSTGFSSVKICAIPWLKDNSPQSTLNL